MKYYELFRCCFFSAALKHQGDLLSRLVGLWQKILPKYFSAHWQQVSFDTCKVTVIWKTKWLTDHVFHSALVHSVQLNCFLLKVYKVILYKGNIRGHLEQQNDADASKRNLKLYVTQKSSQHTRYIICHRCVTQASSCWNIKASTVI